MQPQLPKWPVAREIAAAMVGLSVAIAAVVAVFLLLLFKRLCMKRGGCDFLLKLVN